jgi:hypothetical protein
MPSVTLRAHFNGTHVILDESFPLEPNTRLLVTVLSEDENAERESWLRFSSEGLENAYGDDEPDYTYTDLIEENPSYERR